MEKEKISQVMAELGRRSQEKQKKKFKNYSKEMQRRSKMRKRKTELSTG